MKKKRRRVRPGIKVLGGLIISYVLLYIFVTVYYHDKWYPNVIVNGIDVSNMTYNETVKAFDKVIDDYSLEIVGKDGKSFEIKGKDIDYKVTYQKNLKKDYLKHKDDRGIFGIFIVDSHQLPLKVSYDHDSLDKLINESVLVAGSDDYKIRPSSDARIEYDEKNKLGKIAKEVEGNELNLKKFKSLVKKSLKNISPKINLSDQITYPNIYIKAKKDKNLEKKLKVYNSYLLNWITWDMGEGVKESITPDEIKDWLAFDEDDNIVVDKKAMSDWIEDFCLKYRTQGKKRNFTTHSGKVIEISGGDYGWRLDYKKTVEQVYEILTEKKDESIVNSYIKNKSKETIKALTTELEPIYSNQGYKKDYVNFENDWDTQNYSEVDLTEQKVYVYRDGQLAYTSICVTGRPPTEDRITRTGVWYIKEKMPEKVLVGEDYETPVKYWVRIMWTGTGYHSLNRSDWASWSPTLYLTKGSHGCINLQLNDAKAIYDLVRTKDPVFIHY